MAQIRYAVYLVLFALSLISCGGDVEVGDNGNNNSFNNSQINNSAGQTADAPGAAALYAEQCADCHGETGRGGASGIALTNLNSYTIESLDERIEVTMPSGDPTECEGTCATLIANYLMNGFSETASNDSSNSGSGDNSGTNSDNSSDNSSNSGDSNNNSDSDSNNNGSDGNQNDSQSGSVDLTNSGEAEYNDQCALCHGPQGQGGSQSIPLNNLNTDLAALTTRISATMPIGNTAACIGTCAEEVAKYILAGFTQTPTVDSGTQANFLVNVDYMGNASTLRKAAILFAGRAPTQAEIDAVENGDDAILRSTIRSLMSGDNFENLLMEIANDHFLTNKFLSWNEPAFERINSGIYVGVRDYIESFDQETQEDEFNYAYAQTSFAVGLEPLRLIVNIVTKERPYTELLTADYIMVNPWSARAYGSQVTFIDWNNPNEWQEGTITNNRTGPFPHAGLLTSPMYLARYPSTATNRNRARARWTYYFFLGVDIEGLATRPTDPDALADTDNPTLNNSNCTVCHTTMDPVAGSFQNWSDDGYYRISGVDSLPDTYKATDAYSPGDLWYSTMLEPGYEGSVMPTSEATRGLQWLSQQIIADNRFATGTVRFWFKGIFGQEPLTAPVDSSAADYSTRLAAYNGQNNEIERLAATFRDGSAGTAVNGAYNLKDLMVEMVMSSLFRADSTTETLSEERSDELAEVGMSRLLTPEQLNRKIEGLLGVTWAPTWAPDEPELTDNYLIFYGGIDSDGIIDRTVDINSLMSTVVSRMANELSCRLVVNELSGNADARRLFPHVEVTDTPDNSDSLASIRRNIIHLHQHLLGETLSDNDSEVDQTYALFAEIRQNRIDNNRLPWLGNDDEFCWIDYDDDSLITVDNDHTIRAWSAVLIYLLNDFRFLYE